MTKATPPASATAGIDHTVIVGGTDKVGTPVFGDSKTGCKWCKWLAQPAEPQGPPPQQSTASASTAAAPFAARRKGPSRTAAQATPIGSNSPAGSREGNWDAGKQRRRNKRNKPQFQLRKHQKQALPKAAQLRNQPFAWERQRTERADPPVVREERAESEAPTEDPCKSVGRAVPGDTPSTSTPAKDEAKQEPPTPKEEETQQEAPTSPTDRSASEETIDSIGFGSEEQEAPEWEVTERHPNCVASSDWPQSFGRSYIVLFSLNHAAAAITPVRCCSAEMPKREKRVEEGNHQTGKTQNQKQHNRKHSSLTQQEL